MYSSGHHLPRLEDETCPGTLPCPCQGEQEQCLATEAGTIDIPGGNTTVVQVRMQEAGQDCAWHILECGVGGEHLVACLGRFWAKYQLAALGLVGCSAGVGCC